MWTYRLGLLAAAGMASTAFAAAGDWPDYNQSPTSERHSQLVAINAGNVSKLVTLCTFDTGEQTGFFPTGLLEADGTLYGITWKDTFALDPSTCALRWRNHLESASADAVKSGATVAGAAVAGATVAGAAVAAGRLFRGTEDGRVISYAAIDGRPLWEVRIADPSAGETVPAAPIVWHGRVFIGNAGRGHKGAQQRFYALDAQSGQILWQTVLTQDAPDTPSQAGSDDVAVSKVASTTWGRYTLDAARGLLYVPIEGAVPYFEHSRNRPSNASIAGTNASTTGSSANAAGPKASAAVIAVLEARTGTSLARYTVALGDHNWDVAGAPMLLTTRARRRVLAVAPNAPAYDPATNLLYTGSVAWCRVLTLPPAPTTGPPTQPETRSCHEPAGEDRSQKFDAQWVLATDADSSAVAWKFKAPYPVAGAITSTAGGLVFAGDRGGTIYAFDAQDGRELWSRATGGAIGNGVITYSHSGLQRVAAASGATSPDGQTQHGTAKVIVFGLPGKADGQQHSSHRVHDRI